MPSSYSSRGLRHDGLVDSGSNERARLDLDLLEAVARQRAAQLAGHELEAGQELALLVLVAGLERAAHVVHDRQQGLDDGLGGAQAQLLVVALHALAVVVELGLEAAQVVEVLVALGARAAASSSSACGGRPPAPPSACRRPRPPARRPRRLRLRAASAAFAALLSCVVCFLSVMSVLCLVAARPGRSISPAAGGAAARRRRRAVPASLAQRLAPSWPRPSSWP